MKRKREYFERSQTPAVAPADPPHSRIRDSKRRKTFKYAQKRSRSQSGFSRDILDTDDPDRAKRPRLAADGEGLLLDHADTQLSEYRRIQGFRFRKSREEMKAGRAGFMFDSDVRERAVVRRRYFSVNRFLSRMGYERFMRRQARTFDVMDTVEDVFPDDETPGPIRRVQPRKSVPRKKIVAAEAAPLVWARNPWDEAYDVEFVDDDPELPPRPKRRRPPVRKKPDPKFVMRVRGLRTAEVPEPGDRFFDERFDDEEMDLS